MTLRLSGLASAPGEPVDAVCGWSPRRRWTPWTSGRRRWAV
ncbi:hypothetical protein [Brachybacterium sp. GPGPB12]